MLHLLKKNNEGSHPPTDNNKSVKKTTTKHSSSYLIIIKVSKDNDSLILSLFTVGAHSSKSKRMNKNKDS